MDIRVVPQNEIFSNNRIVGIVSNALLLLSPTAWVTGSIILVDLGVLMGFYGTYLHYWTYDVWGESEKIKPVALYLRGLRFTHPTLAKLGEHGTEGLINDQLLRLVKN